MRRLESLDTMRGLAALGVCLYHFASGLPKGSVQEAFFHYGFLGVDVFFVISGFVIPLWLDNQKEKPGAIRTFIMKRFVRLYPAYAVASFLSLGLWWITQKIPGFQGLPLKISGTQILGNFFLLCDFIKEPWVVPVSWTLAVEWQYYLAIAVSLKLVASNNVRARLVMVGGWIGMPLLPFGKEWLFAYGAVFALGILSFLFWKKQITLRSFILLVLIASFVHGLRFNPAQGFVAGMTSILVILPWSGYRWSRGLGEISYSLYLTHGFSGGRIINLGLRFPEEWPIRTGFFFAAGIVSIVFAWGFYVLVEKPSHMASQRIGK